MYNIIFIVVLYLINHPLFINRFRFGPHTGVGGCPSLPGVDFSRTLYGSCSCGSFYLALSHHSQWFWIAFQMVIRCYGTGISFSHRQSSLQLTILLSMTIAYRNVRGWIRAQITDKVHNFLDSAVNPWCIGQYHSGQCCTTKEGAQVVIHSDLCVPCSPFQVKWTPTNCSQRTRLQSFSIWTGLARLWLLNAPSLHSVVIVMQFKGGYTLGSSRGRGEKY